MLSVLLTSLIGHMSTIHGHSYKHSSVPDRDFKWGSQWPPVKTSEGQTGETGGHNIQLVNTHSQSFL